MSATHSDAGEHVIGGGTGGSGDWRSGCSPARGAASVPVPRYVASAGRRLAKFEFPDSDQVAVQDLGRGIKAYKLEVYVCGDDYMIQRDALETALDQGRRHPRAPVQRAIAGLCRASLRRWRELGEGARGLLRLQLRRGRRASAPVPSPDTPSPVLTAARPCFPSLPRVRRRGLALRRPGGVRAGAAVRADRGPVLHRQRAHRSR